MPIVLFPVFLKQPVGDQSWQFSVNPGTGTITYTSVATTEDPTSIDPEVDPVEQITQALTRRTSYTITGTTKPVTISGEKSVLKNFKGMWHRFDVPSDGSVTLVGHVRPRGIHS